MLEEGELEPNRNFFFENYKKDTGFNRCRNCHFRNGRKIAKRQGGTESLDFNTNREGGRGWRYGYLGDRVI